MQVQRISNNNFNTSFGATLTINPKFRDMNRSLMDFLQSQFPKRTASTGGNLELNLNRNDGYTYLRFASSRDVLRYRNGKGFCDAIEIDFREEEPKEKLLDNLVNSIKGFVIREQAHNKINGLKDEIKDISDRAYKDSAKEFKKSFYTYDSV